MDRPRRACLARWAVGTLALGGAVLPLAGCGFRLRRPPKLGFRRLAFSGFDPASPMATSLTRALVQAGVEVVPTLARAELVFEVQEDARTRAVVAQTAAALIREWALGARLTFRVRWPDGRLAIGTTSLAQTRSLTTTEQATLAKQIEEEELYRAMQTDLADQVLRRLASIPGA